jgi:hypothetical protein
MEKNYLRKQIEELKSQVSAKPVWTDERPMDEGVFWFKPKGGAKGDVRIVQVRREVCGEYELCAEGWALWGTRWDGGRWAGPLEIPS